MQPISTILTVAKNPSPLERMSYEWMYVNVPYKIFSQVFDLSQGRRTMLHVFRARDVK